MDIFNLRNINPNNIALVENEKYFTYKNILDFGNRFKTNFESKYLIFIVMRNVSESVFFYIGALLSEAVPLLVNYNISQDAFLRLLETYRPFYIFIPKEWDNRIHNYEFFKEYDCFTMLKIKKEYRKGYLINKEVALLLSTSGSTGSPKCVKISYKNLETNTKMIIKALNIKSSDKAITTLPMDYTYGLSIINTHLMAGATIILTECSIIQKKFWETLRRNKCTTFGGVPFTYQTIIKLRLLSNLKGIRYLTQAGGKLDPKDVLIMADICEKVGAEFIVMYGQTEATARMSVLNWNDIKNKSGSIGKALPEGKFSVINEHGQPLKHNQEGELIYCGPNVFMGYAQDVYDLAKEDEMHGVLETGDLAYYDEEGFFFITGRKKRIIKLYGNRINLDEIELLLNKGDFKVVCIGTDNKLIIISNEKENEEKILQLLLCNGIRRSCVTFFYLENIPYLNSGKIDYKKLQKLYEYYGG